MDTIAVDGVQDPGNLGSMLRSAAAAGLPGVAEQLRKSHKVHIDGVDNLAHWTSGAPSARNVLYYFNESELTAIRIGPWKSHMQIR